MLLVSQLALSFSAQTVHHSAAQALSRSRRSLIMRTHSPRDTIMHCAQTSTYNQVQKSLKCFIFFSQKHLRLFIKPFEFTGKSSDKITNNIEN